MTKKLFACVAVLGLAVPARALACAVAIPSRALRHDVEAADLVVLARARASSQGTGWVETIEFEVDRVFKGQPDRRIRVVASCDKICWTTCFTADAPVVLFLARHAGDRSAWMPRYQLIETQLEALKVHDGQVATPSPPWKDHRGAPTLQFNEFEELVRKEGFGDREPPLTYRFVY